MGILWGGVALDPRIVYEMVGAMHMPTPCIYDVDKDRQPDTSNWGALQLWPA